VKQYLGTTIYDRDPQGVTSAQPPAPLSKNGSSNRKDENSKKLERDDLSTERAKGK